ncbi:unnamed protein product [Ceratitis capitata]|uniref:(Mediterranean fruit fly) hypothetical protein n=1 Tax=Ceratitis capitata TaxID=7213 RepID=A0A811UTX9_CERCA|nr:unnamed protein product [Ceratitis capitata]
MPYYTQRHTTPPRHMVARIPNGTSTIITTTTIVVHRPKECAHAQMRNAKCQDFTSFEFGELRLPVNLCALAVNENLFVIQSNCIQIETMLI